MQVRPEITDADLVALMQRFGHLTNHRIIRKTSCAFVDFSTVDEAATALEELRRAPVTSSSCAGLVVEFKVRHALQATVRALWALGL